ncbi:DUF1376 domain-containing protein [Bradyrhizobium sp. SEMIA]|uniref:DUF1376 domain-containing protein n=1 Tax=Bradyrhizobium sp. SEMIA TaxID=2597515 RepID=UPI0018A677B7|nr:DUF1376 domain-containing protein [Bradyrhizobium sp. SEMIA]QOG21362.1 DUF1376 domain-containing protein [Bradyrhizobium sp. SEMIA]
MKRRYLNIEIGPYLRDTQKLSALQSGAYLHLLMHYVVHGELPHEDDTAMRMIARLDTQQWRRTKPVLAKFFDKNWHNPRADRDLMKQERISLLRAFAGQAGGKSSGMSRRARSRLGDH